RPGVPGRRGLNDLGSIARFYLHGVIVHPAHLRLVVFHPHITPPPVLLEVFPLFLVRRTAGAETQGAHEHTETFHGPDSVPALDWKLPCPPIASAAQRRKSKRRLRKG